MLYAVNDALEVKGLSYVQTNTLNEYIAQRLKNLYLLNFPHVFF
ncbi:hypothetical protein LDVICp089 [lymphocystis disease virus-China]|uniref:Uncharacterized protein n=1 Tax=lymphocystis disease virus-China TaxID=256729 RepID=Q678C3_9VIRU|nr:hypothetical protein LDVICp089 [lymphocystis disease virus-China]AAU10934.1 hypothetical protein [lymphocystis disease virus-China]